MRTSTPRYTISRSPADRSRNGCWGVRMEGDDASTTVASPRQGKLALLPGPPVPHDEFFHALRSELLVGVQQLNAINAAIRTNVHVQFVGNGDGRDLRALSAETNIGDVELRVVSEIHWRASEIFNDHGDDHPATLNLSGKHDDLLAGKMFSVPCCIEWKDMLELSASEPGRR